MQENEFVYSSTAVRSLESKLLTSEQLDRMIEAPNLEGAVRILQETIYTDGFSKIDRPEDYEKALSYELKKLYDTMDTISPYQMLIDIIELKYDSHNMKILFKDHIMGTDNSDIISPLGRIIVKDASQVAEQGQRKELDKMLDGLATEAVYGYGESLNPQSVDLTIDKRFYNKLIDFADETDVEMIETYAQDYIDFSNLITLFRMQKQNRDLDYARGVIVASGSIDREEIIDNFNDPVELIVSKYKNKNIGKRLVKGLAEYEATGSIAAFEKEFDNHLMDLAKTTKFKSFGPEVIFAYLISREMEIKNIRIILVSKLNGLSPALIRERLRDIYV